MTKDPGACRDAHMGGHLADSAYDSLRKHPKYDQSYAHVSVKVQQPTITRGYALYVDNCKNRKHCSIVDLDLSVCGDGNARLKTPTGNQSSQLNKLGKTQRHIPLLNHIAYPSLGWPTAYYPYLPADLSSLTLAWRYLRISASMVPAGRNPQPQHRPRREFRLGWSTHQSSILFTQQVPWRRKIVIN
jgi:hypothetical protein